MAKSNATFSKIGLITATVGSAVGLGNVWRFPAEVQQHGGAAFLIIYILCVLILGIPAMIAEFTLGRGGRGDTSTSFSNILPGTKWKYVGLWSILATFLIMCFYTVVCGWTFEYFIQSITGNLYTGLTRNTSEGVMHLTFGERMQAYICSDWGPLISTLMMVIATCGIIMMGVQKGIERLSNIMMPVLFILLLIFCGVSLSLPGAADGVRYYLNPDFSKINASVFVGALGQAFFSLSLGMGILITYSAYYPKTTKLGSTALTVSVLDLLVALLMGFIIFPAISSFGLQDADMAGTTLIFVTMPEIFANMPLAELWSALFFLLLMIAALTSCISGSEVIVAWLIDRFKMNRLTACLWYGIPLFLVSIPCSLSFGRLSHFTIFGMTIFDLLDYVATNFMLPIGALLVCIFMGWIAPAKAFYNQLTNNGSVATKLYPAILFCVRYICPLLIACVLISAI